jgi:hypothetical protein
LRSPSAACVACRGRCFGVAIGVLSVHHAPAADVGAELTIDASRTISLVLQPPCFARSERGSPPTSTTRSSVTLRPHFGFNLSISADLAAIGAGLKLTTGPPYTFQVLPLLVLMNILGAFSWLAFTIIATYRAATGQLLIYPMTLRRPRLGSASRRAPSV